MSSQPKKVYLITGCSSGLGNALARAALAAGHTVIATSRRPPNNLVEIQSLGDIKWATLDVSSPHLEIQITETILPLAGGKIDVLINNAGIANAAVLEDADLNAARAVLETNFWGAMRLTKLAVGLMRKQGQGQGQGSGGTIVNISSSTSLAPMPLISVYSASKAAVDGFTTALAAEVAPFNIRVLLVTPGGIRTSFIENNAAASGGVVASLRAEYEGTPAEFVLRHLQEPENFRVDPERAAGMVVQAVDGTGPFEGNSKETLRLPLGGETLGVLEGKIAEFRGAMEGFSDIARSVDLIE
ncbi:hypothetical protein VP1G_06716 [Cytospora mali]|uniref:Oxidoreductase YusZ n=1 Tax=Cytospora mali TaxID=578113 RepID=A0A194V6I4_CYTMA|nr:hypothetical protein VP1G_06716 [Valsa mali var. pyri (nom. inval.)]